MTTPRLSFLGLFTPILPGLLILSLALLIGCGAPSAGPTPQPVANRSPVRPLDQSVVLTIGDIDQDEPTISIAKLQPLADYLAGNLHAQGIIEGRVLIARDIEQMGQFMREGKVDLYIDSPFPILKVQGISGSRIIMRRWKQQDPTYWSIYIARRDSGISEVKHFLGKVLAVEESYSTSGFLLPIGTLAQRGFSVRAVTSHSDPVGPDEIGYYFARDEKNTVEAVLTRMVAGGGISNQDYDNLPPELKEKLIAFDRTITVPRQLVLAAPGLDQEMADRTARLLADLDQTEQGLKILAQASETKRFDLPTPEDYAAMGELQVLIDLVSR